MSERETLREEWEKLCGATRLLQIAAQLGSCVDQSRGVTFAARDMVDLAEALIAEVRSRAQR